MKKLLLLGFLVLSIHSFGQSANGTYVNDAGQKLVITNNEECCFDFEIIWGVEDEWICMFSETGRATYSGANSAYFGDDQDAADIEFSIEGNVVRITGGYDYIGSDCARYGDSGEDTYTVFKK